MVRANTKRKKAMKIIRILKRRYKPARRGEVSGSWAKTPYRVLVSAIISQRTKDETTTKVTRVLFRRSATPAKMVALGRVEIAKTIRSANYYKGKSKRIYDISRILVKDHKGRVPKTREELMKLPGVGGKTADIVMLVSHGADVVPVDTHVAVVAHRLGWTKEKKREKIREDLHEIFSSKSRRYVNILLVEFGKEICRKHRPKCYACPIEKLCPYPDKNLKKKS
jgi:endonuclease-3